MFVVFYQEFISWNVPFEFLSRQISVSFSMLLMEWNLHVGPKVEKSDK